MTVTPQPERRPRIAVLVFPGSNDDRDAAWALGLRRDGHACTSIS